MNVARFAAALVIVGTVAATSGGCSTEANLGGDRCPSRAVPHETSCSDGIDDDCDGYKDCLDNECDGQSCGSGGGYTCLAGACVKPGEDGLPPLPRIDNVRLTTRGDTAIVDFEGFPGAKDYRIYKRPANGDVLVGAAGEVVVKNAIYRCGGDRPLPARKDDGANNFDGSFQVRGDVGQNFERDGSEKILGYVFLTPAAGRKPVYRVADPNGKGGFRWDYVVPLYAEANSADYVASVEARDALVAKGWRDDGIVFYVPDDGTRPVYRREYKPEYWGSHPTRFYVPGPEADARATHGQVTADFGERFKVMPTQVEGSVPLYRVSYLGGGNAFDVLAAGEPRLERAWQQGNVPLWSVNYPGLKEPTVLVIEALDQGCPFPNGYVASSHAKADEFNHPSITVDEARLSSGEVYINGTHENTNRPKPIARAYVEFKPEPPPKMDWYEGFDPGATWDPLTLTSGNNGVWLYRNDKWVADFSGCTDNHTFGPSLGHLVFSGADGGSSCNISITPRAPKTSVSPNTYLHVRMASDLPSTQRRYPQILITTAKLAEVGSFPTNDEIPLHARLGPLFADAGKGNDQSIIVQPFGSAHELQVEFCDKRGWGVSTQCPQANIYGFHAGNYNETWSQPWLPVPVLGEIAGHDRMVQFDVYASTERVYVLVEGKPAGCAVLPAGRMPAGPVTVAFRAVGYHMGIDEPIDDKTGLQYLHRFSLQHTQRHLDDLGIEYAVPAPAWNESVLPCGTRWYGGG
jgi:hypothetical protein